MVCGDWPRARQVSVLRSWKEIPAKLIGCRTRPRIDGQCMLGNTQVLLLCDLVSPLIGIRCIPCRFLTHVYCCSAAMVI